MPNIFEFGSSHKFLIINTVLFFAVVIGIAFFVFSANHTTSQNYKFDRIKNHLNEISAQVVWN